MCLKFSRLFKNRQKKYYVSLDEDCIAKRSIPTLIWLFDVMSANICIQLALIDHIYDVAVRTSVCPSDVRVADIWMVSASREDWLHPQSQLNPRGLPCTGNFPSRIELNVLRIIQVTQWQFCSHGKHLCDPPQLRFWRYSDMRVRITPRAEIRLAW